MNEEFKRFRLQIDRSIKEQKLSTPIYIYGINTLYDAKKVINEGADRILLETILKKLNELKKYLIIEISINNMLYSIMFKKKK